MYMLSLLAGAQNEQVELSAIQKLQFTGNSFRGRMLQEGDRKEGCSRKEAGRKDTPERRQEGCSRKEEESMLN